jgi:hypothetical protein
MFFSEILLLIRFCGHVVLFCEDGIYNSRFADVTRSIGYCKLSDNNGGVMALSFFYNLKGTMVHYEYSLTITLTLIFRTNYLYLSLSSSLFISSNILFTV